MQGIGNLAPYSFFNIMSCDPVSGTTLQHYSALPCACCYTTYLCQTDLVGMLDTAQSGCSNAPLDSYIG